MTDVTQILSRIEQGDPSAADELLPLVYDELRRLAASRMAQETPDHTLEATALVHEAYLRLLDHDQKKGWDSRGHFFAAAAEAMRRILVERARKKLRRQELRARRPFTEWSDANSFDDFQLIALDEALVKLESRHPEAAQVVKLRFFGGMTMPETASALGISLRAAERHWSFSRIWLHRELEGDGHAA